MNNTEMFVKRLPFLVYNFPFSINSRNISFRSPKTARSVFIFIWNDFILLLKFKIIIFDILAAPKNVRVGSTTTIFVFSCSLRYGEHGGIR